MRLAKTGFFKKAKSPHLEIYQELLLHRAVLDKALVDYFSPFDDIRGDVEGWLCLDNEDFIEACERAMLEPEGVFKAFKMFKNLLRGKNAQFTTFKKSK